MKKQILFIIMLFSSFSIIGQNKETDEATKKWKIDSTAIAREKFLLNAAKDVNQIKNDQAASDLKAKNDEIKSNLAVLGDNKLTSLNGNVTISAGTVSTAQTRLKVHRALNIAIKDFSIPNDVKEIVIVYSPTYYTSIPLFKVAKSKLESIVKEFEKLAGDSKKTSPTASLAGIATAISLVNAVANLGTLFKTETQLFVKDESIAESIMISKLKKNTPNTQFYYPSLYPPNLGKSESGVLKLLNKIDELNESIEDNIKTKKDTDLKEYEGKLDVLEKNLISFKAELAMRKLDKLDTTGVTRKIVKANEELALLKSENKVIVSFIKGLTTKLDVIRTEYKKIKDALDVVVDKENNLTALGLFIKIENLVELMNAGAKTLRVSASSKGTDQIKKSLWTTKLKNSATVEIEYQLFNNDGSIHSADAMLYHEGFNGTSTKNGGNQ
jgi:hypothetical protein